MKRFVFVGAVIFVTFASEACLIKASAQTDGAVPAFDVASIKLNTSGSNTGFIESPGGGRFRAVGMTLRALISNAYRIRDFQIYGGPSWGGTDRYDVEAKADAPVPNDQTPLMLQRLLAERFQLKMHKEARDLPVYELSVAKGGPKLESVPEPPRPIRGAAPPPPKPGSAPPVGSMHGGFGLLEGSAVPLTNFIQMLSSQLGLTVIDKTGLTGFFNLKLTWTPDAIRDHVPEGGGPVMVNGEPVDPNGPTIFTAIQEQLGLKLSSAKGAVEVWVIDSVQRPTQN